MKVSIDDMVTDIGKQKLLKGKYLSIIIILAPSGLSWNIIYACVQGISFNTEHIQSV